MYPSLFRQWCGFKVCADRFIICTRSPLTSVLTAEPGYVRIAGHKTLFRQHCWTIYIFQNCKAALYPHFLVAALHQLFYFPLVIDISDSPASPQAGPCRLHSPGKLLCKIIALLMVCSSRNSRITFKPGCAGAFGC